MRSLTKEQTQFIENYLIEQGVKYWDVRIELIDHIATELEENPKLKLTRTFLIREFGTTISLDKLIHEKRKSLNKKYLKLVFNEVKEIFSNIKELIPLLVVFVLYILGFYELNSSVFKYLVTIIFVTPVLFYYYFFIKKTIQKNNSLNLESAASYIIATFLFFQIFLMNITLDEINNWELFYILVLIPFHMLTFYSGTRMYLKIEKKYQLFLNQLNSI